jgi:N-hydroxyarylamine O-acetyltransferase
MLARVRYNAPSGTVRPRTHLVLRVTAEGATWHADVGFGAGTLLEPIPFGPGGVHEQCGWRFRVVEEGEHLVLQSREGAEWLDQYAFVPEPVPPVDIETSNWFTSTHPRSPFVTGLIASRQAQDGARTVLSDWNGLTFTEQTPEHTTASPIPREAIPEVLESRFGLSGFTLGDDGRVQAVDR